LGLQRLQDIGAQSVCQNAVGSLRISRQIQSAKTDLLQLNQQMEPAVKSQLNSEPRGVNHNGQQQQPLNNETINTVVCAAVKNISRRKQNVIVTGLPERDDVTDREAFLVAFASEAVCRRQ